MTASARFRWMTARLNMYYFCVSLFRWFTAACFIKHQVFGFFYFGWWIKGVGFCSTECLLISIYNRVIQAHVKRLTHVQSVFAHPLPLSLSHTLTHSLPFLHGSAWLPASITLSLRVLCTLACLSSLIPPSLLFFLASLYILCTLAFFTQEKGCSFLSLAFLQCPSSPMLLSLYCFYLFHSGCTHSHACSDLFLLTHWLFAFKATNTRQYSNHILNCTLFSQQMPWKAPKVVYFCNKPQHMLYFH